MKKDCKLIATLPSLSNMSKVSRAFFEPLIAEVRFNTGVRSPFSPSETIQRLYNLSKACHKVLWIDLKGRQPRVDVWADPLYECVELNHTIEVDLPAKISFRNGTSVMITSVNGNKIFLDSPPREALGKGQSVNILGGNFHVTDGYLTKMDKEYLHILSGKPAKELHFMASFIESDDDLLAIAEEVGDHELHATYCGKVESQRGLDYIKMPQMIEGVRLMAARDDLFIELGGNYVRMKKALESIISQDSTAICASRIFASLKSQESPSLADFEDLEIMYELGYREFMFDDNICNYAFDRAIKAWEEFIDA